MVPEVLEVVFHQGVFGSGPISDQDGLSDRGITFQSSPFILLQNKILH